MLLAGAYSVLRLQQIMNAPITRSNWGGEPLAKNALYRLFGNAFYAGGFVHDSILCKEAHEPVAALDEFDRAQKIIGEDNLLRPRNHRLPIISLIRCGGSGGMVTVETRGKPSGLSYIYCHCAGRNGCTKHGCGKRSCKG